MITCTFRVRDSFRQPKYNYNKTSENKKYKNATSLKLVCENLRLTGYALIGNRSTFLERDGRFTCLYSCPNVQSPLHMMNQCCDQVFTKATSNLLIRLNDKLILIQQRHAELLSPNLVFLPNRLSSGRLLVFS